MYYYLFDSFVNNKKYKKTTNRIEHRLTDLGLHSKIGRLSMLNSLKELVQDQIKRGVKTIVMVGDDNTFMQGVDAVANYNVVLGMIPIGPPEKNHIAKAMGIPLEEKACDVLSARIIETIDLGKINNHYFFSSAEIQSNNAIIRCDGKYNIRPNDSEFIVQIYNFNTEIDKRDKKAYLFDPKDGYLETLVKESDSFLPKISNFFKKSAIVDSIFSNKKVDIIGPESIPVLIDKREVINTPATIEVVPKKLKVIVGKERMF